MASRLLNDEWRFARLEAGSTLADALALNDDDWQAVDIPHDWLIGDETDLYRPGDGWYRRTLDAPADCAGSAWRLCFDGVYQDCQIYVNGQPCGGHRYGYTAFGVDIGPYLRPGGNEIMVRVRHESPNSRWYSGAGIFRDVTQHILPIRHIAVDGIYVHAAPLGDGRWQVSAALTLEGPGSAGKIALSLIGPDGDTVAQAMIPDDGDAPEAVLTVERPVLWSCDQPSLYTLRAALPGQETQVRLGLRTTAFDPDRGFILNGQPVKLRGVCLHHDLGALGAAFRESAFRRQIALMKQMGANAVRFAHNPPARRALDVCDELGMLVLDELYDMWKLSKTPYDHARFFEETWRQDVRDWVARDRNHPCVILWSIGNEILDTHVSGEGAVTTRLLMEETRRWDPKGNGAVTLASNYMPWENARACADIVGIAGYNYGEKYYADHHAAHPDWVIYGSETASILSSRGVYHFPADAPVLSEEDEQCSALGNSMTSWGTQDMRRCIIDDLNTPYSMGQFLWSGIDYIGEPTPYHTRCCYFGMADTALFPKDFFYQVKALWNPEPMAHIGVNWDWNAGQLIDVPVYTNGASCELLLNGESLGEKAVDVRVPENSLPMWRVPYAPGVLTAVARDAEGREIARDVRASHGDSARLHLAADRTVLRADGEDMAFVTVTALDDEGRAVENAADRVFVGVDGPVCLMGLDNGDSTDPDGYKVTSRCLFGGKLLVMLGAGTQTGAARLTVRAEGLEAASLTLEVAKAPVRPGVGTGHPMALHASRVPCRVPARRIDLTLESGASALTPDAPEAFFRARLLPAGADDQPIRYRVVNARGIESGCAQAVAEPGGVRVIARGDGQAYLRAVCANGAGHARVLSQLEISVSGFGEAALDPYGFVAGGLYDLHAGEITPGNEKGIAFARDGQSMAGFSRVDFGPAGSDEITLPVFALDDSAYEIGLWMGVPGAGGHLVAKLPYQKKCRWNVYQSQTWTLPERFCGLQAVCFTMDRKIHLKGFSFARQSRAWRRLSAGEADAVYGDSFVRDGDAVRDIGNNVSLVFSGMDFEDARHVALRLWGHTPLAVNPVRLSIAPASGEASVQECAFSGDADEQTFDVAVPGGLCTVTFVFMPGSRFDFEALRFERR